MLKVKEISIGYGDKAVIKDVSFTLSKGEILAIVGENGAGKTTLLKSLNNSLPVQSGEILLEEKVINSFSRREIAQRIAVIAQENETKFPVTVLEFILAGRFAHTNIFGWETESDFQIAENALRICDLAGYENRRMNQLSGGERQRIVLARALATEAQILLLDEPTANLDLAHQMMMFRLVRERCRNSGAAAIITHDLNLASEFADEILLLKRGEVVSKGKPEEVLTVKNLRTVFEIDVFLDR
nr:ABC transporter ATP-binding protein [Acidobacteriota bacterium]